MNVELWFFYKLQKPSHRSLNLFCIIEYNNLSNFLIDDEQFHDDYEPWKYRKAVINRRAASIDRAHDLF